MSSRSFIDQINDCCTVGYIGNISIVSNLDCHIACSIFRNYNNDCAVALINHPDVISSCIDPGYGKCCAVSVCKVLAVTVISDIYSVCSNSQVFYNQTASAIGNRNSVSADTNNLNGHVSGSISRNRDCDDFNITKSNVFSFN